MVSLPSSQNLRGNPFGQDLRLCAQPGSLIHGSLCFLFSPETRWQVAWWEPSTSPEPARARQSPCLLHRLWADPGPRTQAQSHPHCLAFRATGLPLSDPRLHLKHASEPFTGLSPGLWLEYCFQIPTLGEHPRNGSSQQPRGVGMETPFYSGGTEALGGKAPCPASCVTAHSVPLGPTTLSSQGAGSLTLFLHPLMMETR